MFSDPISLTLITSAFIALVSVFVVARPPQSEIGKAVGFFLIAFPVIFATAVISMGTLEMVQRSPTGGPIHWHADFEVYACGEKIMVESSKGLSNKTGTPLNHTHNDERIHIEGTPSDLAEASLGGFFKAIGGIVELGILKIPTDSGMREFANGDSCEEGAGEVQVFRWRVEEGVARQSKMAETYEPFAPYSHVPPGDCYIIEFGAAKDMSEHVCSQYLVAQSLGELIIEVPHVGN